MILITTIWKAAQIVLSTRTPYFSADIIKACSFRPRTMGSSEQPVAWGEYITIKNAPTIDLVARPRCFQLLCKPTQFFIAPTVVSIEEMVPFS